MVGRFKKFATMLTLTSGIAIISGCEVRPQRVVYLNAAPIAPNFFVCNEWMDRNQNGRADDSEFVGIKNNFRSYERITLIGKIIGKRGANLEVKVYNGQGNLTTNTNNILTFDECVSQTIFEPNDLRRQGGTGDYKVEFYLQNNLVGSTNFQLND